MIIADTGAMLALADRSDRHHVALRDLYQSHAQRWVLPWAILAEVDYLLGTRLGDQARRAFMEDLAVGVWRVEWASGADLQRADDLDRQYSALRLGLVDACVMAIAERLGAEAIATLDLRHFGVVTLRGNPKLYPRDL